MVVVHDDDRHPPLAQVESVGAVIDKEHMFDKVVTPSDVGKLNRLVIPKQHAEKYFPLDSSTNINDKGLLLNFEDTIGKAWRFRYSYWNSSQSYVLTKGWSRFVKDKKLEAGDTVSFHRGVGESAKHRLYIDYTHRPGLPYRHFSAVPWSPLLMRPPIAARDYFDFSNANRNAHSYGSNGGNAGSSYCYNSSNYINYGSSNNPGTTSYVRSLSVPQQLGMVKWHQCISDSTVFESVPVVQGKAAAKRLRLFGVNMDCPSSDSEQCDKMSTSTGMPPHRTLAAALHPSPSFHPLPLQRDAFTLHKGYSPLRLDLDI